MNRPHLEAQARAGVRCYPAGEHRLVARVLGDIKIVLDSRDFSLTPHLVMDGFWESWITCWFLANLSPVDRVLNIGANCGYYALAAARAGCQVVAVEPQSALVENLRLSASLNGHGERLVVTEAVAGVEHRDVVVATRPDFMGEASVDLPMPPTVSAASIAAEGGFLTKEIPAHELMPNATVAFVDAEGYEAEIWKGLAPLWGKRQLRWVALEWAPWRYEEPAAFLRSLRDAGAVSVVDAASRELQVDDAKLLDGTDWDMIVVRPRWGQDYAPPG